MAKRMLELAREQPGFLGVESVRENGLGVTVSYWASEDAIGQWKQNLEHREAQSRGQSEWYSQYKVRVARVERDYGFGNRHNTSVEPLA
ncbi:antibiotic biosynthesis monooxygenase [Alkalilimnicola ehrlichii]|nr:antibiotic biosynthesis monooxygenase [Alkalilimnicola ehrlichii]